LPLFDITKLIPSVLVLVSRREGPKIYARLAYLYCRM
jgi:hypothetical protein